MAFAKGINTSTSVWRNGQADTVQLDAYEALLRILVQFMADKPTQSVSYTGTGNGLINFIDGGVGGVTQVWTVAMTSPTAYTVTGSVSGAQAGGTTGTDYTTTGNPLTSLVSFRIDVGGIAFVAADAFTITDTANTIAAADVWVLDAWNPFDLFSTGIGDALWWHGEGDGTQAIYCGIRLDPAASPIFDWVIRSATGFSVTQDWETQPGVSPESFVASLDSDMVYWLIGNARRYSITAKTGSTYQAMYQGLFLPFGSPAEYPLPIANLGQFNAAIAHNSTTSTFHNFPFAGSTKIGHVRDVAGAWLELRNSSVSGAIQMWPNAQIGWNVNNVWDNHENFNNGDHQLFPMVLIAGPPGGVTVPLGGTTFGVLDGVRIVTGFGNSAETVLTISTVDHIVFQNIFRSTAQSFYTMEMA